MSVVVGGVLCDGGSEIGQGWNFFSLSLSNINNANNTLLTGSGAKIQDLKIYNRYLLTSEVIGNWRAGIQ